MAIGIGNTVIVRSEPSQGVHDLDCDKATNDIIAFVYRHQDSGDTESYVKLGNIDLGTFGSEVSIDGVDIASPNIVYLQDTKLAVFYRDNDAGADGELYGAVVNTSNLTPVINLAGKVEIDTDFEDVEVSPAMGSASLGLLAYRNNDGGFQQWWQRINIAGNSVTLGSSLDNDDDLDDLPNRYSLCAIGVSRYVYVYGDNNGDLAAVVLNAQVGLSKGTKSTLEANVVIRTTIIPIDSTHCFILYEEDDFSTTKNIKAVIITIAGDTITFGTPITLDTGGELAELGGNSHAIKRSATKFVVAYEVVSTSGTVRVESLTINGTTITEDGDSATFTGFGDYLRLIGFPGTEGLIYYQDGSNAVYRVLSNLPEFGDKAKFYHGLNTLTEKFTLPWAGVQPQAMTLDRSLGTVVMGSNEPSNEAVIYSQYPYVTGTSSSLGFPTGTSIRALKWI